MPWGKWDDGLYDHRKVEELPRGCRNACVGLWGRAISWSNRSLSDGLVPEERLRKLDARPAEIEALVRVGLLEVLAAGQYQIHDFLEFNKSREEVLADREAARDRQRRSRGYAEKRPNGPRESHPQSQRDSARTAGVTHTEVPRQSQPPVPSRPNPDSEEVPLNRRPTARAKPAAGEPSREIRLTKAQLAAWETFRRPEWKAFTAAWLARGLRWPPFGSPGDDDDSQRGALWRIAQDWPTAIAGWVASAPKGAPAADVVAHVFARFHEWQHELGDDEADWTPPSRDEAKSALTRLGDLVAAHAADPAGPRP